MLRLKKFFFCLAVLGLCACCGLTACGQTADSTSQNSDTNSQQSSQNSDTGSDTSSDSSTQSDSEQTPTSGEIELVAYFAYNVDRDSVILGADAEIETTYKETGSELGGANTQTITIDGGEDRHTLTATGEGVSDIKAANNGTLVFKNLRIVDTSYPSTQYGRWPGYLEFGGKLRFENCDFDCSILLMSDAEATFVNCSFEPQSSKMYGVWISDGSATFTDCSFTGLRALKMHEEYGKDIENVTVDNCTFTGIVEKPGVAIGTICNYPQYTTVTIKNSTFENCLPFELVEGGAGEGYDGFYESDTPTDTFNFILENNLIDGEEYNPEYVERADV